MTRRLTRKRSIDATDQQGPVKRLKSETYREHAAGQNEYSTRHIPWEEQKRLGPEFVQAGENCWPVQRILQEGLKGRRKRYLVAWKPHPETGEEFEPIWRSASDVGDELIASWKQAKSTPFNDTAQRKEKSTTRQARNRRLLPNSSDKPADSLDQQSDAAASPPSLLSGSSVSGLEISETQDFAAHDSPRVNLPSLPTDKHDYETIGSSQFSPSVAYLDHPSPEAHLNVTSSQKDTLDPILSSASLLPSARRKPSSRTSPVKSPQSKISESSPQTSSTRSTRRSKLSRSILADDDIGTGGNSSSRSLRFITQLPASKSPGAQSGTLVPSSVSPSRSARLSSPFQDFVPVRDSSSSTSAQRRRRISVPKPFTDGKGLMDRPETRLEAQSAHTSSPQVPDVLEIESSVAPKLLDTPPSSKNERQDSAMASPSIDVAPLEVTENHLFTQPNNESFELNHDVNPMTLTIHESIEDEPSSADNSQLLNSKANSSQESLNNEREVETVDGIMIPVRPLLGPNEFAVSLPAEGKVKSQYDEIIKLQKKAILRFISRTGSPGTSEISSKKTMERNAMQDLLHQLNNTVTHTDLGLPMHTQYSLNSEANAAYAEYAGTKFELLGYLVDSLKDKDCSVALFSQSGSLQDLLEEYLTMKRVNVRRHDNLESTPIASSASGVTIDLVSTQSSNTISLEHKPLFIIAFDVTFTVGDPQVKTLQDEHGEDLPILHFLVTNSSEHVERCVPDTLTSNIRLKVVVRTTYLAARNLGGDITYVPRDGDPPLDSRTLDMGEFQRAVRKSPARRLFLIADVIANLALSGRLAQNWPLGIMPELKLGELETPPKVSRAASRTPQPRTGRHSTPASRAVTPVGKRKLLDVDGENGSKRLRLTPVRDVGHDLGTISPGIDDNSDAKQHIATIASELANVRTVLSAAEQSKAAAEAKTEEWQGSHAEVLRRYEKERLKSKDLQRENKKLNDTITNYKDRDESLRNEKVLLRQQLAEAKVDVTQARADLIAAGGDVAELEKAREETRILATKVQSLEKQLKTTKADFEFTRDQYQDASKLAMDRTTEVKDLEDQVEKLKIAADDNKRSLKAMNYQTSLTMAMSRAEQFRLEVKNREALIRKLQEENATLKSRRGVQTRGSSIQPASSPGPRSRQASPAPTHLMPPSGSRASILRHNLH